MNKRGRSIAMQAALFTTCVTAAFWTTPTYADDVGACCRDDGTGQYCENVAESKCDGPCDRFRGEGTSCATVLCAYPVPSACCLDDGSCEQASECVCQEYLDGNHHDWPVTCTNNLCPQPGACCRHNLNGDYCEVVLQEECNGPCDYFMGEGTNCDSGNCLAQRSHACCLDDGSCETTSNCVCTEFYNGTPYSGDCEDDPCPQPGACCRHNLNGDYCEVVLQEECDGPCDYFMGEGTNCDSGNCLAQRSHACCLDDGSCETTSSCVCTEFYNGTPYSGDCEDDPCPQPGACCRHNLNGDYCEVVLQEECDGPCDYFMGEGTNCDSGNCLGQASHACCLDDGSCETTSSCVCTEFYNGTPYSGNCENDPCPQPGACCRHNLNGDYCEVVLPEECDGPCDYFMGEGTNCDSGYCLGQRPHACCLDDGSCQTTSNCVCREYYNGTPYNGECEDDPCPQPGACCRDNPDGQYCEDVLESECDGPCDHFRGEGTNCATALCAYQVESACCLGDGSCEQASECVCKGYLDGNHLHWPVNCSSDLCPQPGACCRDNPDGQYCEDVLESECDGPCDHFRGEGTNCATTLCAYQVESACCLGDGSCEQASECVCKGYLDGNHLHWPVNCSSDPCPQPGACCRDNPDGQYCEEGVLEAECNGPCDYFKGEGSACGTLPCLFQVPGACCLDDQSCETASNCVCNEYYDGDPQGWQVSCASDPCQ